MKRSSVMVYAVFTMVMGVPAYLAENSGGKSYKLVLNPRDALLFKSIDEARDFISGNDILEKYEVDVRSYDVAYDDYLKRLDDGFVIGFISGGDHT